MDDGIDVGLNLSGYNGRKTGIWRDDDLSQTDIDGKDGSKDPIVDNRHNSLNTS